MSLRFASNWLDREPKPSDDELGATMSALRIAINDRNVTEYSVITDENRRDRRDAKHDKLHIPAYYLAEWIAENWWPILCEPRKSDDSDDVEFHSRHSLAHAQHGFALPDVQFELFGDSIQVMCKGRDALPAGVWFPNSARAVLSRGAVQGVLTSYVQECVNRLEACKLENTPLQKAWGHVIGTTDDELPFCELVGSLGGNPYDVSETLSRVVDKVFDALGKDAALDACRAITEEELILFEGLPERLAAALKGPHEVTLAPLERIRVSPDNVTHPSWRRGKNAAITVRSWLDIKISDSQGTDKFLDRLDFSTARTDLPGPCEKVFTGAIDRDGLNAVVVLPQQNEEARRFAACRSIFLGMISGDQSRRLVTNAMLRDQQASRAFAAEIMVPSDYLKSQANGARLSRDTVLQIARQRRASTAVVKYQADNNGLLAQYSL